MDKKQYGVCLCFCCYGPCGPNWSYKTLAHSMHISLVYMTPPCHFSFPTMIFCCFVSMPEKDIERIESMQCLVQFEEIIVPYRW